MKNKETELKEEIERITKLKEELKLSGGCWADSQLRINLTKAESELKGYQQAKADFKENMLMTKTNHQLGCMLECYEQVISNRIGFEREAKQLMEIASKLK